MTNHVSLRAFIERILAENNIRRDAERDAVAEALRIQAKETERRLESYPTLRDFNDLKNRVDVIITLWQVLAGLAVIGGIVIALFTYVK